MPRGNGNTARWPQPDASAMLQRHAELRSLGGEEWKAALADATVVRSTPASTQVFQCGRAPASHFGIVLEGAIRVRSLSGDGRALSICRVHAGELCMQSLTAIYSHETVLLDLAAEGRMVALQIPAFHLPLLLAGCEAFRGYLMSSMSKHVATLLGRIEDRTFGCLKSRILGHLREVRDATGCGVLAISHQELAEELGSTREAVSRTLKQMERRGTVGLGRRSISLAAMGPEISAPVPRDASGVMETRRLGQSFQPAKAAPQKRPGLRLPLAPRRKTSRGLAEGVGPGTASAADRLDRDTSLEPSPKAVAKSH